jgi:drug/metabolite transporter (DMT)-like permease
MVPLAYFAIYVIWGSTFLAIRVAIETIPPLVMMGVRCTIAGSLLLAAALFRGERPAVRAWGIGLAAGALMFGFPYAALAWAELRITSGMAALLVATLPLWLVIIEWLRSGRPSPRTLAGLGIGLVGVIILVSDSLSVPASIAPMLAIIGGELAWALGSVYLQPRLPQSITLNAGMPLLSGGALLLLSSGLLGEMRSLDLRLVSAASLAAVGYLTLFGSIVAFSAYVFLLRRAPASRVSTHAYVNPLIAVSLGVMLAGEPLTTSIVIASLVIAAGVALVLSARQNRSTFHAPRSSKTTYGWLASRPAARS